MLPAAAINFSIVPPAYRVAFQVVFLFQFFSFYFFFFFIFLFFSSIFLFPPFPFFCRESPLSSGLTFYATSRQELIFTPPILKLPSYDTKRWRLDLTVETHLRIAETEPGRFSLHPAFNSISFIQIILWLLIVNKDCQTSIHQLGHEAFEDIGFCFVFT